MTRLPVLLALAALAGGCASAPFIKKQSFDCKTTALFKLPCDSAEVVAATNDREDDDDLETLHNACNSVHMQGVVENFMRIRESDEQQGVRGDTLEEVR